MAENLNTGHLEEAQTVNQEPSNLHDALAQATEYKNPSQEKSAWDFSNLDESQDNQEENENIENKGPEKPKNAPQKVSDEVKRDSARTATVLFSQLIEVTGTFAINQKFKKKLSPEEKQRIIESDLEDKLLDEIDEADRILKKKFDRLLKQRDKKIKAIPLSNEEEKRCENSFYEYFKIKDISMPPEWMLGFTLGTILIDRTIEVVAD